MDDWQRIDQLVARSRALIESMTSANVELKQVMVSFKKLVDDLKEIEDLCSRATETHSSREIRAGVRDIRKTVVEFRQLYERWVDLLADYE